MCSYCRTHPEAFAMSRKTRHEKGNHLRGQMKKHQGKWREGGLGTDVLTEMAKATLCF